MSTQDIKQGTVDLFLGLLKGPYALPAMVIGIVWLWIRLTPDEVARIHELGPLMNSSIGIAFAFVIVMSYIFNLIGTLKKEIHYTFTSPLDKVAEAITETSTALVIIKEEFEKHIERGEKQRIEIKDEIKKISDTMKPFFEER